MADPAEAANGDERGPRAGERALSLLATPLNLSILRALSKRPMRLADLRQAAGLPAQTTLRGHLGNLRKLGMLTRIFAEETPHAVENELTPMGRELLEVADLLEGWLHRAPDGPIALDSEKAKSTIKAFIDGWGSTIMGDLAVRPMSLTELDSSIVGLSYPALERRLSSMRMANLIEAQPSQGTRIPYAVTEWSRRGVLPLAAASRFESLHLREEAAPVTRGDIEAAFMLATPLVGLEDGVSGRCRLEVDAAPDGGRGRAGVDVTVRRGAVVACESRALSAPADFATGSTGCWFGAIVEDRPELLRFGGAPQLAEGLVRGLHRALVVD